MVFKVYFVKKRRQKKTLIQLQADWDKQTNHERNFDLIEKFSLLTTTTSFHQLSQQTIVDIDFHDPQTIYTCFADEFTIPAFKSLLFCQNFR